VTRRQIGPWRRMTQCHGERQAMGVSYVEWERLSHVPKFGRLLMEVPLTAVTAH